jgi:hypothetical protein
LTVCSADALFLPVGFQAPMRGLTASTMDNIDIPAAHAPAPHAARGAAAPAMPHARGRPGVACLSHACSGRQGMARRRVGTGSVAERGWPARLQWQVGGRAQAALPSRGLPGGEHRRGWPRGPACGSCRRARALSHAAGPDRTAAASARGTRPRRPARRRPSRPRPWPARRRRSRPGKHGRPPEAWRPATRGGQRAPRCAERGDLGPLWCFARCLPLNGGPDCGGTGSLRGQRSQRADPLDPRGAEL